MIKCSFGQDEEYVAVIEDECDDLARTSDDACRAYQEIVRMLDEGWMVEFRGIALTGFHSCTSHSYYWSVSKQTTRYE
ncbi:hypothetical protein Tco_1379576 [Tanacetum coccineum]